MGEYVFLDLDIILAISSDEVGENVLKLEGFEVELIGSRLLEWEMLERMLSIFVEK